MYSAVSITGMPSICDYALNELKCPEENKKTIPMEIVGRGQGIQDSNFIIILNFQMHTRVRLSWLYNMQEKQMKI